MIRNKIRYGVAAAALSAVCLLASVAEAREFCGGVAAPLTTPAGRNAPYLDLLFEGKSGPFLLDYGASASSLEDGVWSIPSMDPRLSSDASGAIVTASSFSLPGWTGQPVKMRVLDRNIYLADQRLQHGVIGVDLVERQNIELHYEAPEKRYAVISAHGASCDTAPLKAGGFFKLDQTGHWASGGVARDGIHNGPVAHLAIEAATGAQSVPIWAQIDTGYEDSLLPNSVEVNKALYEALKASGTPLQDGPSVQVTGCDGIARQRRTFTVPGRVLQVRDVDGEAAARTKVFHLILKESGEGCGGIGAAAAPAAQLGASFLKTFGTTLFLGSAKEVWIRPVKP